MTTKKFATMFAPVALAAMIGAVAVGGTAFAAENGKEESNDAALMASSKVSLSQAISAAEQQSGGKAISAGVDNQNGRVSISVDVTKGQGVQTVMVDPQTGQVTGTQAAGAEGDAETAD